MKLNSLTKARLADLARGLVPCAASLLVLGAGSLAIAQESAGGEGTPMESASQESEAAQGEESGAGEPSEAQASEPEPIDVDAEIAEYNEGRDTPRQFDAREREWISKGVNPADVDRILSGELYVPNDDPYKLVYIRDGEERTISSNPRTGVAPVADNVPAYGWETAAENRPSLWAPFAASETAKEVDAMFNFIMWICYIFAALIAGLMIWFCIKYRRRPGVRADQSITHNTPLEIFWSVIPTILVAIMFWGGYTTFLDLRTPPPDAMQVKVNARQWGWDFTYPNGVITSNEFHVPENTPVEMLMSSSDVIHSFHLPAFRQKSDVLPNRYTKIWYDSGTPATYRVYCAEYCGKSHSNMYAKMVVEPKEDFDQWLADEARWYLDKNTGELLPPVEIGQLTYDRLGCKTCHSLDGTAGTGPTFKGLWGKDRELTSGETVVADENYIRQSMIDPHSQIVAGYGEQMTVYGPLLNDAMVDGMIAYLKTLADD